MFLHLLFYFLLPSDQYNCIVNDITFQLHCNLFPHVFHCSFIIQEHKCEFREAHCGCNHFILISIILIRPVCRIYLPFVFANCICAYNFRLVESCIIQNGMSMGTTSNTGIKLSCCPFKKSCTLLTWWLLHKTLHKRIITDNSLKPVIKELSCEERENGNV